MIRHLLVTLVIILCGSYSHAVDIQFPEDELARESVYPVFDNPTAVKRRNVGLEGRVELGLYGGWALNNALVDPMNGGLLLTYHFSEIHAVQLQGGVYSTTDSQYVPGIQEELPANQRNLTKAPKPKYIGLLNYQISPYYGKLSITKQAVLNLSVFFTAGIGTIAIGDSNYMAFSLGLGQKLYFSEHFGLRADLKALFHQQPNALSKPITNGETPPNSYYETQNVSSGLLTIAAIYTL